MSTPLVAAFRWATPDDNSAVRQVIHAAWKAAYGHIYSADEIRAAFSGESVLTPTWTDRRARRVGARVGEIDGSIVATAGLATHHDGSGEITTFYVLPDRQGQGLGGQLWLECVNALQELGCPRLLVWTLEKSPACRFYEHLGCSASEQGSLGLGGHVEPSLGYVLDL